MKVMVIGTGSIGQRHIENLLKLGVEVVAYSYRGLASFGNRFNQKITLVDKWQNALADDLSAVIVANSTEKHLEVALEAAQNGKHLYIEKPLSISLQLVNELTDAVEKNQLVVESGFMMRCHPNLKWIRTKLQTGELGEVMHMRASVGQWLPDWRPGTDHRLGYGAFRATGGGVIFDLIHELDLANWLLGPVKDVTAMTRNVTCLELGTESIAQIGLMMSTGVLAQIHLDYVRQGYNRHMEVVCRHGTLAWDYLSGTVQLIGSDSIPLLVHEVPAGFERNNMFTQHLAHFLNRIEKPEIAAIASLPDAIAALRIALACHASADQRKNMSPQEI